MKNRITPLLVIIIIAMAQALAFFAKWKKYPDGLVKFEMAEKVLISLLLRLTRNGDLEGLSNPKIAKCENFTKIR